MARDTNTLGLTGDGDEIDLLQDIESAFDLTFAASEVRPMETVGDIERVLAARIGAQFDGNDRCASAMAFYRLRRAFAALTPMKMVPSMPLAAIPGTNRHWLKAVSKSSGLCLPAGMLAGIGYAGLVLLVLPFLLIIPFDHWHLGGGWLLAMFVAGVVLVRLDPLGLPAGCVTVGDLARKAAVLNIGRLAKDGARAGADDLWNALREILVEHTALPRDGIHRDTRLLHQRRKAA